MDFSLKIIAGTDVYSLIEKPDFILSWTQLAKRDKKFTVIQEHPFVITWYKQYKDKYIPVLCLGYNKTGELVGLMPLAKSVHDSSIVHAGAEQGEYDGWISYPEIDEHFPVACLIEIKRRFNARIWQWKWLVPGAPVDWLCSKSLSREGIYAKYKNQNSPLWDLTDTRKLEELLRNKTIRKEINRYKRRGDFYLERVFDKTRTQELMPTLKKQYDFRQGTIHGLPPFKNDSNKAMFYIERQNYPNSNHFTVLWSNNKPIAFHYAACDDQRVLPALISYDPLEAKNSPATLLLIELSKKLTEEGFRFFDLTPGGGQYKERFANSYQMLYRPTFFFSRKIKIWVDIREKARSFVKHLLMCLGLTREQIRQIRDKIKKIPSKIRRITPIRVLRKVRKLIYDNQIYLQYRLRRDEIQPMTERDPEINIQKYEDLLGYTGSSPWVTLQQLLLEASRRFASGEILYSINRNGILAHWGWMTKGGREHKFTTVNMSFHSPQGSISLYDFYTEPEFRRQGLYTRNLRQMVSDSFKSGATEVYIGTNYGNIPSQRAIERVGFTLYRRYSNKRLLWWRKKEEYCLKT